MCLTGIWSTDHDSTWQQQQEALGVWIGSHAHCCYAAQWADQILVLFDLIIMLSEGSSVWSIFQSTSLTTPREIYEGETSKVMTKNWQIFGHPFVCLPLVAWGWEFNPDFYGGLVLTMRPPVPYTFAVNRLHLSSFQKSPSFTWRMFASLSKHSKNVWISCLLVVGCMALYAALCCANSMHVSVFVMSFLKWR